MTLEYQNLGHVVLCISGMVFNKLNSPFDLGVIYHIRSYVYVCVCVCVCVDQCASYHSCSMAGGWQLLHHQSKRLWGHTRADAHLGDGQWLELHSLQLETVRGCGGRV